MTITMLLILMVGWLNACKTPSKSNVKGHYEHGDTEEKLRSFRGKLVSVPEYARAKAVLMSSEALRKQEIVEQFVIIAKSQIPEMILVTPPDHSNSPLALLKWIDATYGTRAVYNLGSAINKIKVIPRSVASGRSLWIRDYAPLTTRHKDSGDIVLVDFNYMQSRQSDDAFPEDLARAFKLKRIGLPLYNEGGNFMVNDNGDCLMTDRIIKLNAKKQIDSDEIYDRIQIERMFKDYLGCKRVVIFPSMPHEATQHIDIWAKFLTNKKIVVSRMSQETVNTTDENSPFRQIAIDIKNYLDARIPELQALGFEVIEVPMPAPDTGEGLVIRSYTNSLLVHGTAFVPIYKKNQVQNLGAFDYIDGHLTASYEKAAKKAYSDAGLKYIPIEADALIQLAGAVHCSTIQLGLAP